ncbi:uncharacterized protein DFL_006542 [Arthrobotrys flagrans]|uniref:MYND-type domain-containing protein n=1 Tax=Arthrobotrys flagrans TaxID=97331 RepID=A0A436ZT77_ARTFL|nr:hypothetical protein DFL_006542 [Arthrobotrys flagrans]
MASDPRCTFCWKAATDLCGRCKAVRYCGRTCQRADWKTHKVFCGVEYPVKDGKVASYRGVLFAVDEEKPRFMELPVSNIGDSRTASILPMVVQALGELRFGLRSVNHHGRLANVERELMRGQLVLHCHNYNFNVKDDLPPNLALREFTGLGMEFDMPGAVVITKERRMRTEEFMDVELDDLKDMVDILRFQMRVSAEHRKIIKNFDMLGSLERIQQQYDNETEHQSRHTEE